MTNRERVINVLSNYKSHAFGDKDEKVTVEEIIALLKKSFTPEEVYKTVIEYGQHDMRFRLGDRIDYTFTDVIDILNTELMCKAGDM